jgi:hypothetical protein
MDRFPKACFCLPFDKLRTNGSMALCQSFVRGFLRATREENHAQLKK